MNYHAPTKNGMFATEQLKVKRDQQSSLTSRAPFQLFTFTFNFIHGGAGLDSNFERDLLHFWALLFQVVLDGEKRVSEQLAQHGLTTPQFYVLKTLIEQDGKLTIGRLAKLHGLTNATMTGLVKRLEAFEPPLLEREVNVADRRSVYVLLTDAGRERFLAVQTDLMNQLRAVLSLIPADERQSLLFDLTRYVAMLTGRVD